MSTYAVDGRDVDPGRAPAELVAIGKARSGDYDAKAARLDGDLWDVAVLPI